VSTLYVDRTIEIRTSPKRVWEVLTKPEFTAEWAKGFGATGPIESDWLPGSEVRWRNAKGDVYVRGNVVEVVPQSLLKFTVCDVFNTGYRPVSGRAEDEITQTYALKGGADRTTLATSHGDFANLAGGEKLFPIVGQFWDKLLPQLKALAEG
jgi:uncharacterized protein YndB with AHSA1/START domain